MKELFEQYLDSSNWLIWEKNWDKDLQQRQESLFTLGNGYLGSRGIYEEIPPGACPGTFIAGVYDSTGAQVTELINAPNPIDFRIISDGEKLDPTSMDVVSHSRVLDISKGLLARKTIYSNNKKNKFNYQSLRFFSMRQKHIGAMQVCLTPMDSGANITVESAVDDGIRNKGIVTEGRKKHFHINEFNKFGPINYLCVKTFDKDILISYATILKMYFNYKTTTIPHRVFHMHVKKGETVCFTRYFSIHTSWHISPKIVRSRAIKTLRVAANKSFEQLLKENTRAWSKKWNISDVQIGGDSSADLALRFNIYHLLIAGNDDDGMSSIGAKTLSGEGYRGHVFWDMEIFMLPFYIFTQPLLAKSLLLYRYKRLEQAKKIALDRGYKGALFPWESADSGEESTPSWHKDFDGRIIEIYTMLREHHISADIAFAVWHYYTVTNDHDFMINYGLEMLVETARFWMSRLEWNNHKKSYCIRDIIGPDEFHERVNDNAYTNVMAKWNINTAVSMIRIFKRKYPDAAKNLLKRLKHTNKEIHDMTQRASLIDNTAPGKKGIFEEFDGYFNKKYVRLKNIHKNIIPEAPIRIKVKDFNKTQFVKQADVLMFLYLLSGVYSTGIVKKNYEYYIKRTLHKSSLSPAIHAIMASRVGDNARAYKYFEKALYIDLQDFYGNTVNGIHAASLGGVWQSVINGFAGVQIINGKILSINPNLPQGWRSLKFTLKWNNIDLYISVYSKSVEVFYRSKNIKSIKILAFRRLKAIFPNNKNYIRG